MEEISKKGHAALEELISSTPDKIKDNIDRSGESWLQSLEKALVNAEIELDTFSLQGLISREESEILQSKIESLKLKVYNLRRGQYRGDFYSESIPPPRIRKELLDEMRAITKNE